MDNGREDKLPWTRWFWQDYEADAGLRASSLAAQGLWMRMLSIMAKSKKKGCLLDGDQPMANKTIGRLVGEVTKTISLLMDELENHGVFSRLEDGTIINRKMYKEHELSSVRSEAGKHGAIKRWGLTKEDQERLSDARKRKEDLGFPIYSLIASQRRTAAKNKGTHTDIQWQNLKQAFDFTCPCCEKNEPEISLTKDHIIPVSLGGSDHISNIQPLCQSCNSSKGREKTKWQKIAKQNGKKENDVIAASASAYASASIFFEEGVWGGIRDDEISAWSEAYPACNVLGELKKMAEWLKANPDKKKIRYRRFIVNWLSRTQDRGGSGDGIMANRDHRAPDSPYIGASIQSGRDIFREAYENKKAKEGLR